MSFCRRLKSFITIGILWLPALLPAQKFSIKWNDIPNADLEMKTFPEDTNASAVILGDVGNVYFNDKFEMVFTRHRRVKILSSAGYHWGNFAITYYAKDGQQTVTELEGQTVTINTDGTIRRDKLDKKAIFNEDVDGKFRRMRLTLPALAPGVIVEYRYKIYSQSGTFLRDWEFQTSEPTRVSEFRIEIPAILEYAMLWQGAEATRVSENENHWMMRDVPALRAEPFMTTPSDYRAAIRFQLAKIHWSGQSPQEVMSTWPQLATQLMYDDNFGLQIEKHDILRQQAVKLVTGLSSPEEKMRAIYDYVRTTMIWDGDDGIFTEVDLAKAFQTRRAGSPEIALIWTSMLRFAGLREAHPVLISTRDHGKIVQMYSILRQFNRVLTLAQIGTRQYLLDATDPLRSYDLLPEAALNETGWLVDKTNPRWINISSAGSLSNQITVTANLSAAGAISGRFSSRDEGYSGLFERRAGRDKKDEARWLAEMAEAVLDSMKISHRDSIHLPLTTEARFTAADYGQVAGDKIYLNPVLLQRQKENPFKQPERTFPVDFAYPRKLTYILNLRLPEGFIVQELPKNLTLNSLREGLQFRRQFVNKGNSLQLTMQLQITRTRFEPVEYKALCNLYDQIVAAHAEQIVLKRWDKSTGKEGEK